MLKLSKIVKNYRQTGALSENVSVYGFLDEHVFLTKAGDLGMVLNVEGVDYECLDHKQTDLLRTYKGLRDRDRAARYGLNVGDVQDVIEIALGGKQATELWEGDKKFAVARSARPSPLKSTA